MRRKNLGWEWQEPRKTEKWEDRQGYAPEMMLDAASGATISHPAAIDRPSVPPLRTELFFIFLCLRTPLTRLIALCCWTYILFPGPGFCGAGRRIFGSSPNNKHTGLWRKEGYIQPANVHHNYITILNFACPEMYGCKKTCSSVENAYTVILSFVKACYRIKQTFDNTSEWNRCIRKRMGEKNVPNSKHG